jgi:hypothetical protein
MKTLRSIYDSITEALWNAAYDWSCGAKRVNWPLIVYFGAFVPGMIFLTLYLVKGCNSGQ